MTVQGLHSLGIELLVIRWRTDIDGTCEFHTQKTAATRGVSQYIGLIGGGNERGATRKVLYMTAVGTLDFDGRQCDDIL